MAPLDPPTIVLTALPALYTSIIVHEAGHALIGYLVGFEVTSFGAGTARPFCVIAPWGVRIYLAVVRPLNGLTFVFLPQLYPSRMRMALFAAGGVLANTVLSALGFLLWLWLPWGSDVWLTIGAVNGLMGFPNLIPFQFRMGRTALQSDGALILRALRFGTHAESPPMIIQLLSALRGLWLAIGDTRILRIYLLSAAEAWTFLGDIGHAESLCREAESLPVNLPPSIRHLADLVRGEIALSAGRVADAQEAFDAAESGYREEGNEIGLLFVSANRAIARILGGDSSGGRAELDGVMAQPLVRRQPEIGINVLAGWLVATAASSDTSDLERLRADYEQMRQKRPSETRDLRVYASLARFHAQREEWTGAESHYRRVIAALGGLTAAWGDPAERARFLAAQSALLEDLRGCFQTLGRPDEAEALIGSITAAPPPRISRERDLRFRRWGTRLILGNIVLIASAIGLMRPAGRSIPLPLVLAVIMAAFGTIPGVLYLVFDATIGRLIPTLRQGRGLLLLLLSGLPWMIAILTLLICLLMFLTDLMENRDGPRRARLGFNVPGRAARDGRPAFGPRPSW